MKQERTDKLVAIFNEFIFSLSYFFNKRIPSQIIFSVQEIAQQNKYCSHKG
ncbi:hypothetical protein VCNHCC008D_001355 [Vibrio cholerae O1 str. NHCC-008D]|nr:hypothetical protein VCNHCC008D_001355 [Vibrio cholerae O1 str. NHCC-008D]